MCLTQLFRSRAFKALLERILGDASVVASRRQARRFRPGLDYTLATPGAPWEWKRGTRSGDSVGAGSAEGQEKEEEPNVGGEDYMVLDAVLCFVDDREPYKEAAWRQDEVGGYVTYLGGDDDSDVNDEDDDSSLPSPGGGDGGRRNGGRNGTAAPTTITREAGGGATAANKAVDGSKNDAAVYKADEGGSLVSVSAASNALSLVLRDDTGITSFVKYVSSAAPGSRFDVAGEYLVVGAGGDDSSEDWGNGGALLEIIPEGESGEDDEKEEEEAKEEEQGRGTHSRKKLKSS